VLPGFAAAATTLVFGFGILLGFLMNAFSNAQTPSVIVKTTSLQTILNTCIARKSYIVRQLTQIQPTQSVRMDS